MAIFSLSLLARFWHAIKNRGTAEVSACNSPHRWINHKKIILKLIVSTFVCLLRNLSALRIASYCVRQPHPWCQMFTSAYTPIAEKSTSFAQGALCVHISRYTDIHNSRRQLKFNIEIRTRWRIIKCIKRRQITE